MRLAKYGAGVSLVLPGFVDTQTSGSLSEPRPFLIDANAPAEIIAKNVERGARHIVVPWQFAAICVAARLVPRPLPRAVLSRFRRSAQPDDIAADETIAVEPPSAGWRGDTVGKGANKRSSDAACTLRRLFGFRLRGDCRPALLSQSRAFFGHATRRRI